MNDFVLRGFCKKCEWPIALEDGMIKGLHEVLDSDTGLSTNPIKCNDHKMEPIWFLSPAQMKILEVSKEIWNYEGFADMLERNPFLVAKILKETGEDSKEENK